MLEKGEDLSEIVTSEKKKPTSPIIKMESVVGWMGGLRGVRITSNIFIIIIFFVFNYPIMTFLLGPMKVEGGGGQAL